MSNINKAFENKKAFIGFLTAGDPCFDKTVEFILDMEKAGCTLIEIGIPFSDPIAEGPVIQEANLRALAKGMTTDKCFELVQEVRKHSQIPLVFLTYLNPVYHYGYESFFKKSKEVGLDGIIIPDLPYEERDEVNDVCTLYDIDLITLIAPTSIERVKMLSENAKGFIYLVSSMGVTGTRSTIETDLEGLITEIRSVTNTPIAVGFGIHTQEQVQKYSSLADGVIVGSAIVKIIAEHGEESSDILKDYIGNLVKIK